jgi:hypothetical protein
VPDSFSEHVHLMFDLMAAAFEANLTRVVSFKMGRDGSSRVYPESGCTAGFHPASHHQEKESSLLDFQKINTYHVGLLPYVLAKLKSLREGETDLLEQSIIVYGSPMGDSNLHNHKRLPLILIGHLNGELKGNTHIHVPDGTPMANVWLSLMQHIGVDVDKVGDSTGPLELNDAAAGTTTAS